MPIKVVGPRVIVDSDGYESVVGGTALPRKVVEENLGGGSYRIRVMVKHPVLGELTHSISTHP